MSLRAKSHTMNARNNNNSEEVLYLLIKFLNVMYAGESYNHVPLLTVK